MAYEDLKVEELKEEAKNRELSGYSTKNKDELVQLLNDDDSQRADKEGVEGVEDLSDAGQEAASEYQEGGAQETLAESNLSLDAGGPLILQNPSERVMTGAVSEDHAKEQAELAEVDENYTGDLNELGQKVSDPAEELSTQEHLERVIDFPPPLAHREGVQDDVPPQAQAPAVAGTPFGTSSVAGSSSRSFAQKSVFYTDGLSGGAEHNLERAYEIPESLQTNNPAARAAGDESLSEAAKEERSENDENKANEVINRDK